MSLKYLIIIGCAFLLSCAAFTEAEKDNRENKDANLAAKYEETFDPSDFDEDIDYSVEKSKLSNEYMYRKDTVSVEPEIINGFRVQILMTKEIEEANKLKTELNSILQDDWVYVIFESPYYKVRVGDFAVRGPANETLKYLIESGYKNSWIVPDKIIKNPPPKPKEQIFKPEEH